MMRAHGLTSDSLDERDLLAAVRRGADDAQQSTGVTRTVSAESQRSANPCDGANSPRVRFLCTGVLEGGGQHVGWKSRGKRGDDEGEEAEDAERMRPSCVGDCEEPDPGHEASDREPREQPWCEGGEQRARLGRPLDHALATAEVSAEHESEEQRER